MSTGWSNWVLQPSFPYDIAELIQSKALKKQLSENYYTQLRLSEDQIMKSALSVVEKDRRKPDDYSNTLVKEHKSPAFLSLLLILVFCIERLLSERLFGAKSSTFPEDELKAG
jgi:hypothetical protein